MDKSEKVIVFGFLIVLVGCLVISLMIGVAFVSFGRGFLFNSTQTQIAPSTGIAPTATSLPEATLLVIDDPIANDTIQELETEVIPEADLNRLAELFEGKKDLPTQLTITPTEYLLGDETTFYVLNVDSDVTNQITASLRYITDNVYFWVENGIDIDKRQLKLVVEKFAHEIYPVNQEFFGKEWIPGVDNDPRLYILYARNLGNQLAGYTSTTDPFLPAAHEYSNAHEMFYINADVQTLDDPYTLSVMAHEFQHLIHGYQDSNEELWLNEGFSELATFLNGYNAGGFDSVFVFNPDLQLNDWSSEPDEADKHYGASFLFVTYLLDRFGEEITKQVVANSSNGFRSIDEVLALNNIVDDDSGMFFDSDELFMDWVITNYLLDPGIGDGRYTYSNYTDAPQIFHDGFAYSCDGLEQVMDVSQYGTDYYELSCPGKDISIHFAGSPVNNVLPLETSDGRFMWSNRADSSNTSMTKTFDFSGISGPITFQYQTWYDLEKEYDYLYLLASDDSENWEILSPSSCTLSDPNGNSYGCGYNGNSEGWRTESVDLSEFSGKRVTLSFQYVTDGAITGEGMILDDLQIREIGYFEDFENSDGGWETEGFVRINNQIPQTFLVSVVSTKGSQSVQKHRLDAGEVLDLTLAPLGNDERYVLIISGSSRYTRQKANYTFRISE